LIYIVTRCKRGARMKSWGAWLGIELSVVSPTEKIVSVVGGFVSIVFLVLISGWSLGPGHATALVASMGASAVLLFAVPHGQLSQPWPVLAGHAFSALIGVACAKWIARPELAAACAVGLAIGVMHQFKCIHPPGGATALTAVMGGKAIHDLGFGFALFPVLTNGLVMVGIAVAFNWLFGWRRYPSALGRPASEALPEPLAGEPSHEQVVAALRSLDSFVDISEEDLIQLSRMLAMGRRLQSDKGKDSLVLEAQA
jgi:CBS-domain-containing membrane protein